MQLPSLRLNACTETTPAAAAAAAAAAATATELLLLLLLHNCIVSYCIEIVDTG